MFNEETTIVTSVLLFLRKNKAWLLFILGFVFAFFAYTVGMAMIFFGLAYLVNCDPVFQSTSTCDKKLPFPFFWIIGIIAILFPIIVFLVGRKRFLSFVIGFFVAVTLMLLNLIFQEVFGGVDFLEPLFELFDT